MTRRRDHAGHSCLHHSAGYGIKHETRLEEIMKKLLVSLLLVPAALLCSCAKQGEQKSSTYIAKVGSEVITQEDVNRELKGLPPQIQNMFAGPEGAEKFVDELVKRDMLSQEAKKKGFDNDAEYKKKVEEFKKLTLISLLLQKEVEEKAKATDKDVKDYYEAHKAELTTNNQVRASHIPEVQRFARSIQRDKDAVLAGLTEPWSNGVVEGKINKLKLIKRMMYGRAEFPLLRQRVLYAL